MLIFTSSPSFILLFLTVEVANNNTAPGPIGSVLYPFALGVPVWFLTQPMPTGWWGQGAIPGPWCGCMPKCSPYAKMLAMEMVLVETQIQHSEGPGRPQDSPGTHLFWTYRANFQPFWHQRGPVGWGRSAGGLCTSTGKCAVHLMGEKLKPVCPLQVIPWINTLS